MYYTFIMLKPDALQRGLCERILDYFLEDGMQIAKMDVRLAESGILDQHYEEVFARFDQAFRVKMYAYFENKYVVPMVLASENKGVIQRVRELVGKTDPSQAQKGSVRGDLGTDSFLAADKEGRSCYNLIHASDSPEAAEREIGIWFGQEAAARFQ